MKQATCNDLRGACEEVITGTTAEEMGEKCKKHVMDMMAKEDAPHLAAIQSMQSLSKEDQMKWHNEFVRSFDSLKNA